MLRDYLEESAHLHAGMASNRSINDEFDRIVAATLAVLEAGGKIMAAGNGGSAADAQHFTAEFVAKYKIEREAYPAMALTTDTSALTAIGNDYAFENIFERQVEAFGKPGDILFCMTTSGNSQNIIKAIMAARSRGVLTVALLGKGGGHTKEMADFEIVVPSDNTPRIQEAQKIILHSVAEEVEKQYHAKHHLS